MTKTVNKWLEKFQQTPDRQLNALEKYSIRLGWFGTGMILVAPHLLPNTAGIVFYILSAIFLTPQVLVTKQWNLVLINANVIIAYTILYFNTN